MGFNLFLYLRIIGSAIKRIIEARSLEYKYSAMANIYSSDLKSVKTNLDLEEH